MITTQLNQQTRPIYHLGSVFNDKIFAQNQQILGSDSVVLHSEKTWAEILLHFHFAFTTRSLEETFHELTETWRHETKYISSIQQITSNTSYQQIIGLGEQALPLIFEEMQQRLGHWFVALQRITRTNPIQTQNRGNIEQMTADWLNWGRENGYVRF